MPTSVTRDRRQFKTASQPAPVEEDDQPASVAPVEEAPEPAPVAEAPTLSPDPEQRAQQHLAANQARFAQEQTEKNPFIFSNAIPDINKAGGRRYRDRVVAQGERDFRQQEMAQRSAEVQRRRQAVGQQKTRNAQLEERYRSTGQQFYTDPFGDLKPIIEASSGRPLFHASAWEEGVHPKTGQPILQKRDQYGQRQFKTPQMVASPDLTDDQLYYKFADDDLRPAGKIDDLVNHPNFDIARLAKRTASARKKAMWKEAIDPLEQVAARATIDHDLGQQRALDLQEQLAQLNERSANMDPAILEEKEGGILGIGAKPTQRALKAQEQRATLDSQIEKLSGDLVKINDELKTSGSLGRAKRQAALDVAIFKAKALHDNYSDLADERRLILRQQGKSEKDDPTLDSILAAQEEYGAQLERGIGASQHEDTTFAPAAAAQPTPREEAASPTPPPDAPKDIKKQWAAASPIQRLKMMMGVQRGNTPIEEAPPAIGSEAAGTKGSAFTVPEMKGEGILPGVVNAANKFTSGLTTPENFALMVGGSLASFTAKVVQGTKAALAAHAAETGINAAFTAQMAKDTIAASKEAYKVLQDPNATDKQKADAITGAVLSGGMTTFAGKGAVEGAKSTAQAAKKVSGEKKAPAVEPKKSEPSAAAKAAEERRAKAKADPKAAAAAVVKEMEAGSKGVVTSAVIPETPKSAAESATVIEPALKEKEHTPPPGKSAAEAADVFKSEEARAADQTQAESKKEARIQQLADELSGGKDETRAAIIARRKGLTTDQFLDALESASDQRRGRIKPSEVAADVNREAQTIANSPINGETPGVENVGRILPKELETVADTIATEKAKKTAKAMAEAGGDEAFRPDIPEEAPTLRELAQPEKAKESAQAIESQLGNEEALRRSPVGGEKLKEDLKRRQEEPPEEAPAIEQPAPKAPAPERVGKAAVRFSDGEIRTGDNHALIVDQIGAKDLRGSEDGFVTDSGRFVSREEAMKIARDSGQTKSDQSGLTAERLEYDRLQAKLNELGPSKFGTPEYQETWRQAEAIKNRNKGMPPGEVAGEGVSNEPQTKSVKVDEGAGKAAEAPADVRSGEPASKPAAEETVATSALESTYSAASKALEQAKLDYRSRKIGDKEFLAARKAFDDAKAALPENVEQAKRAEQERIANGTEAVPAKGEEPVVAKETHNGITYEYRLVKRGGKWTGEMRTTYEGGKASPWDSAMIGTAHNTRQAAVERFVGKYPEAAKASSDLDIKAVYDSHQRIKDQVSREDQARRKESDAYNERVRAYRSEVNATPLPKGTQKEITINGATDGNPWTKQVDATVYGDWAIRKDDTSTQSKYVVTHVPSGFKAMGKPTLAEAKEIVKGFIHSGIDASKPDLKSNPETLKKLMRIIQAISGHGDAPESFAAKSVSEIKETPAPISADVEKSTPASVEGDKINRNWTAFDKDSGTLGIPREEMPQIKSENRGALVQFLKARGVEARAGMIDPRKLKPTQLEFSPEKVQAAREHTGSERPLLISGDNHVIDGHHQWMAALDDKSGTPMPVIKLNAPVDRLLSEIKEFPSAENAAGAAKPATKVTEATPEAAPRLSDRAIEALKKARISKPGNLYAHTPFTLAWDGAIDTAILAIRAGRSIHDAVQLAVDRFKARFPEHTADDLSAVEQAVRDSHTAKPAEVARVEMSGVRAQVSNLLKKGQVEEAMTYTRDAVDNIASVFGREEANSVKNDLTRAFEGKIDESSNALAFAIESGADRAKLAEMRAKVEASTKADPKWKQRALDAIDFADKNLDTFKPIVDRYNQITGDQIVREQFAGIDTLKRDNYVMHKQDIDESLGHMFLGSAGEGNSSFRKNRRHETFADSIAAGVDPKSLNAVDLLQSRVTAGQQMANKRAWVESLKQFKDPVTGAPVAVDVTYTKRPDGSQYADAPNGYSVERVGNAEVAVMKGYEGIFSALTDASWWNKSPLRRNLQRANAAGKSINLFFDTFHLGRLAAWNAATRLNALGILGGGVKAPNPFSHKEGLLTLDQTPAEIVRIAKEEGRSEAQIKQLLENKQKLNMALETGANFGKISDALHQDVMHNLPITGTFSKWLFDRYQRGAMSEIWLMEYSRQREMGGNKSLTDQQVARKVSEEVNTRFGNLGRQGIFKSKTGQDIARLLLLAPQWNEGLIRSEIGATTGAAKSAVNAIQGKGIATSMLTRSLATMVIGQFVANQLINQYTRGKYTWDNPEEGMGAKLSAWIPDKVGGGPGFFLHPAGIGAEITHLLTSKYERTADFRDSLGSLVRSRLSAIARPLATYILKSDALGRSLRPDDLYKEVAKDAVPLPIPTGAVTGAVKSLATGDRSEQFPGQFQKQLMATAGVKTDQAPTPGSRIGSLASEFNRHKGIQPSGEFYAGDYTDLATALRVGNKSNAESTLKDLLAKHSAAEVAKHFARQINTPFTGNSKREPEFIRSLTLDQKNVYRQARRDRAKLRELANAALRSYMAKNKVDGMAEALQEMLKSPSTP